VTLPPLVVFLGASQKNLEYTNPFIPAGAGIQKSKTRQEYSNLICLETGVHSRRNKNKITPPIKIDPRSEKNFYMRQDFCYTNPKEICFLFL